MVEIKGWSKGADEKDFKSWSSKNNLLRIWAFRKLDSKGKWKGELYYEAVLTPKKTGVHKTLRKTKTMNQSVKFVKDYMRRHPNG